MNKETIRKRNKSIRIRRWIWEYKSNHPCVDCGESDPLVLQFDHVRGRKRMNISDMAYRSWRMLHAEIKKCEMRCANCHLKKTARQFESHAYLPLPSSPHP